MTKSKTLVITFVSYVLVSAIGIALARAYLLEVGDTSEIGRVAWLLFWPFIGAAMVHGIFLYVLASSFVLPLVIFALKAESEKRPIYLMIAVVIWIGIGTLT